MHHAETGGLRRRGAPPDGRAHPLARAQDIDQTCFSALAVKPLKTKKLVEEAFYKLDDGTTAPHVVLTRLGGSTTRPTPPQTAA